MNQHLLHFSNRLREQFVIMLLFALLFATLGYVIPHVYFQYFDRTQYYQVKLPIKVENKIYQPCDYVNAYIERKALVDLSADAVIELRLLKEDGSGVKDIISKQTMKLGIIKSIDANFSTMITHWYLPCTIIDGRYVFEGTVKYFVNGVQKTTVLQTEDFVVKKGGE